MPDSGAAERRSAEEREGTRLTGEFAIAAAAYGGHRDRRSPDRSLNGAEIAENCGWTIRGFWIKFARRRAGRGSAARHFRVGTSSTFLNWNDQEGQLGPGSAAST
jgi:hypothetical protein